MNNIVTVKNLEKNYHTKKAVDGINFVVNKGEILGLLGPNGAGKSTTINILATILSADKGEISILGYDLKKDINPIKQGIGIVPQDLAIYEEISAEKNVRFFASLYNIKGKQLEGQVKEALELVALYDKKDDKPKTFSGGMKRRLNIACGIAHQPQLIIMDEPTVGIDPQSRNHILESIKTLKKRGATVIYSTHYMEEVEAICDRIIIMNDGKIIAEGTKEELKKKVNDEITYSFSVKNLNKLSDKQFYEIDGVTKVKISENTIEITNEKLKDNLNEIISKVTAKGCKIESMSSKEASLETVFLELTGRNLRD
ncbi:ABC transporter ATP-binding protein [Clostridium sp.]|jgi:ABC-2 type transport system ATP-binding protein|uniref:ABC transporter ATP-binding protein n=1 Tax=Clostridium sp. TaxID=1506 RepID=UPI0025853F03|nr:ABC transporter ATP-binding protein [Clostridium sp.]MDF2505168.1 antibiotic transporter ATP-binding protein [Clostridium sp.]